MILSIEVMGGTTLNREVKEGQPSVESLREGK